MGCNIVLTQDPAMAAKIILQPDLYDRISDDHCPPADTVEIPTWPYYLGTVDGAPASLFVAHSGKIHYMVAKSYRRQARILWYLSEAAANMERMYCEIPSRYMDTINFARHVGFTQTDISAPRYLKHGRLYPVHTLRKEYGLYL